MDNKRKWVIFDLDGTIANIDERRRISDKGDGKIHWGKFFDPENIKLDEPNIPVIETFKAFKSLRYNVAIFSGRSDATREKTEEWLEKHGVKPSHFIMRPDGDFTPDDELKKGWLDEYFPGDKRHDILCVFDDRNKVVNMWREEGLACFQVAEGNF